MARTREFPLSPNTNKEDPVYFISVEDLTSDMVRRYEEVIKLCLDYHAAAKYLLNHQYPEVVDTQWGMNSELFQDYLSCRKIANEMNVAYLEAGDQLITVRDLLLIYAADQLEAFKAKVAPFAFKASSFREKVGEHIYSKQGGLFLLFKTHMDKEPSSFSTEAMELEQEYTSDHKVRLI